jgi:hypothetical protein
LSTIELHLSNSFSFHEAKRLWWRAVSVIRQLATRQRTLEHHRNSKLAFHDAVSREMSRQNFAHNGSHHVAEVWRGGASAACDGSWRRKVEKAPHKSAHLQAVG